MNSLLASPLLTLIAFICFCGFPLTGVCISQVSVHAQDVNLLANLRAELVKTWPKNRSIRIVFHGHSVPAGYFRTPTVRTFDAYPSLFHRSLCDRYPTAVIDVSVTAIGGENSVLGAKRFERDVLSQTPDLVFIDYGLNDRGMGLKAASEAWRSMILACKNASVPMVLLTPTPDANEDLFNDDAPVAQHAAQIRQLAAELGVLLIDSHEAFRTKVRNGESLESLMAQGNHPNRAGHEIVAELLNSLL